MVIKNFFITDARESPGKVYRIVDGRESVYYSRSRGRIYSIAFSNRGTLYFVDANDNGIYGYFRIGLLRFTRRIYTHSTYVRDLVVDDAGNIYFSESSGARANGKIYRIERGSRIATLFQEIELSEVGGFWAGDFTFDTQNNLYISSGNRIPASIYKFQDGVWEEIFREDTEPIRGLTFLSCDLLCYANWRSEIYILDIPSGSKTLVYANPTHMWLSDIALFRPQVDEETLYEGTKIYTCDSGCWRVDGTVDDTFLRDMEADNENIRAMLADIGLPTTTTEDDNEIWNRTRGVWVWLREHGLGPEDSNFDTVCEYDATLDHWPTIADFAYMYTTYGGFCWEGYIDEDGEYVHVCTCMCRANTLVTLLYRVGIPADRLAIAKAKMSAGPSQHNYVVVRIGCHWYYIDPATDTPELNDTPESFGEVPACDYTHPYNLKLIPGSTLTKPMLVR